MSLEKVSFMCIINTFSRDRLCYYYYCHGCIVMNINYYYYYYLNEHNVININIMKYLC